MHIPIATDNADAVLRVRTRLIDDVGLILNLCGQAGKAPFWALCRMMFPIAESIAYLLYNGDQERGTSARLSRLLRDELSKQNSAYAGLASVICQVWRHGLTHTDEAPILVVDAAMDPATNTRTFVNSRSMSWSLRLWSPNEHLQVLKGAQSGQFKFNLDSFYAHLLAVLDDAALWAGFAPDEIKDRYNDWTVKYLDVVGPPSEKGLAAAEIKVLIP